MLRIPCPVCGTRDETEFTYGGDATVERPALDNPEMSTWVAYVFERPNPRGTHHEFWHHASGCRQWLIVERDTLTHEIANCSLARSRR